MSDNFNVFNCNLIQILFTIRKSCVINDHCFYHEFRPIHQWNHTRFLLETNVWGTTSRSCIQNFPPLTNNPYDKAKYFEFNHWVSRRELISIGCPRSWLTNTSLKADDLLAFICVYILIASMIVDPAVAVTETKIKITHQKLTTNPPAASFCHQLE